MRAASQVRQSQADGFQQLQHGVDSHTSPSLLQPNQLAWAVNATMRNGFIMPRPGWVQRELVFPNGDVQAAFEDGLFQNASDYLADNLAARLTVVIAGRFYLIDVDAYTVQDMTAVSGLAANNPILPHTYFTQAENFQIAQNGSDPALIYDGASLRRSAWSTGTKEVPTGTVMAYAQGRLWIAVPSQTGDSFSFVAGDLAWSQGSRADVLKFTENSFLAGGGQFTLPFQAGPIRAIASLAVQDTSTGQGPIQVLTTRGIVAVNAPFDRDLWASTQSPIISVSCLASGAESNYAVTAVNGDLWMRSHDGIRSFMVARRDWGTWVNTPLSSEVDRALRTDTESLLHYGSSALFDNRLLVTVQPYPILNHGTVHMGMVALDFEPVTSMFERDQPVWNGVWTGLRILQLVTTQGIPARCFAFVLDANNKIKLWELTKDARFDAGDTRIQWSLETASFGFSDQGWDLKRLNYGDFWLNEVWGNFDLTARYREDGYPFWRTWGSYSTCAQIEDCAKANCDTPSTFQQQYRARVRLPMPPENCDGVVSRNSRLGYRFQARLDITGWGRIDQFRLFTLPVPEPSTGACP